MTHYTILWLGQVISAAVYAVASLLPGSAVLGNVFFDTGIQSTPAIYTNTTKVAEFSTTQITFPGGVRLNNSGGLVPLIGALSFSEVNGYASGALAIQNPLTEPLLCRSFVLDVTSNGTAMKLDVMAGTGTIAQGAATRGHSTGSVVIADNVITSVRIMTLTGSSIVYTETGGTLNTVKVPKFWKLYGSSDTANPNTINIVSGSQTGNIVGTYFGECYRLQ